MATSQSPTSRTGASRPSISSGKFQSGFSLDPAGKKVYVTSMAVARDGKIYVARDQKIFVYDATGKELSQIGDDQHRYDSVTTGGDGKLYAIADSESIVRLKPDGTVDLEIPDTFTTITGDMDIDTHVAADGLGNMYIVGAFHYLVLKYTASGNLRGSIWRRGEERRHERTGQVRVAAGDRCGRIRTNLRERFPGDPGIRRKWNVFESHSHGSGRGVWHGF